MGPCPAKWQRTSHEHLVTRVQSVSYFPCRAPVSNNSVKIHCECSQRRSIQEHVLEFRHGCRGMSPVRSQDFFSSVSSETLR